MNAPVDVLAQEIRSIDGSHSMGAGRLAEALMPFIEREFVSRAAVAELIEASAEYRRGTECHVRDCVYCHDRSIRMDVALARIGGAA